MVFWYWWILSAALLVLEMLSMTFYLLWIAIGAAIAGGVALLIPSLSWEWQGVIFAVWSVLSVYLWYRYNQRKPLPKDQEMLNRRGTQYIGKTFTLIEPIVNGQGKVKVGDTPWLVQASVDLPVGTVVVVQGYNGSIFQVSPSL